MINFEQTGRCDQKMLLLRYSNDYTIKPRFWNVVLLNGRFWSIGNYAHGMVWYCHYCPRASIAIIAHGPEGPTGNNEAMLAHGQ